MTLFFPLRSKRKSIKGDENQISKNIVVKSSLNYVSLFSNDLNFLVS